MPGIEFTGNFKLRKKNKLFTNSFFFPFDWTLCGACAAPVCCACWKLKLYSDVIHLTLILLILFSYFNNPAALMRSSVLKILFKRAQAHIQQWTQRKQCQSDVCRREKNGDRKSIILRKITRKSFWPKKEKKKKKTENQLCTITKHLVSSGNRIIIIIIIMPNTWTKHQQDDQRDKSALSFFNFDKMKF